MLEQMTVGYYNPGSKDHSATYRVSEEGQDGFDDVVEHSLHLLVTALAARRDGHQRAVTVLPIRVLCNVTTNNT